MSYAVPVRPSIDAAWRRGGQLITTRTVTLPDACIRCNAPGAKRFRKDVYWHEPWVYLLILPGILIYAICALVLRKKATFSCSLCATHARRRSIHLAITWLILLAGIGVMILGFAGASGAFGRQYENTTVFLIPLGIFTMLGAAVYSVIALPLLKPKRIDEQYAYFSGAGDDYLRNFQEA